MTGYRKVNGAGYRPGLSAMLKAAGRPRRDIAACAGLTLGSLSGYVAGAWVGHKTREAIFAEVGEVFDLYPKRMPGYMLVRAPDGFRMTGWINGSDNVCEAPRASASLEAVDAQRVLAELLWDACTASYSKRPERAFHAVYSVVVLGESGRDIAKAAGITGARMYQIIHRVLRTMAHPSRRAKLLEVADAVGFAPKRQYARPQYKGVVLKCNR